MPRGRIAALVGTMMMLFASIPADARAFTVSMRDGGSPNFFFFGNDSLIVVVGDSVRWVNATDAEHTVTAYRRGDGSRPFDSSERTPDGGPCAQAPLGPTSDCIQPEQEFSVTFDQPGTYNYFCKVHGQTAAETVKPNPARSAQGQPCGMCAVVDVRVPTSKRPGSSTGGSSGGSGSGRGGTSTSTPKASVTPTASVVASPTTNGTSLGAPVPDEGGGGAKTAIALLAIVALSGAGYMIWRKFLVVR